MCVSVFANLFHPGAEVVQGVRMDVSADQRPAKIVTSRETHLNTTRVHGGVFFFLKNMLTITKKF